MKITFYRSAANEKQALYKASILSVTVPDTVSQEQAISTAIRQFQERMKVASWQELAEFYEIT